MSATGRRWRSSRLMGNSPRARTVRSLEATCLEALRSRPRRVSLRSSILAILATSVTRRGARPDDAAAGVDRGCARSGRRQSAASLVPSDRGTGTAASAAQGPRHPGGDLRLLPGIRVSAEPSDVSGDRDAAHGARPCRRLLSAGAAPVRQLVAVRVDSAGAAREPPGADRLRLGHRRGVRRRAGLLPSLAHVGAAPRFRPGAVSGFRCARRNGCGRERVPFPSCRRRTVLRHLAGRPVPRDASRLGDARRELVLGAGDRVLGDGDQAARGDRRAGGGDSGCGRGRAVGAISRGSCRGPGGRPARARGTDRSDDAVPAAPSSSCLGRATVEGIGRPSRGSPAAGLFRSDGEGGFDPGPGRHRRRLLLCVRLAPAILDPGVDDPPGHRGAVRVGNRSRHLELLDRDPVAVPPVLESGGADLRRWPRRVLHAASARHPGGEAGAGDVLRRRRARGASPRARPACARHGSCHRQSFPHALAALPFPSRGAACDGR